MGNGKYILGSQKRRLAYYCILFVSVLLCCLFATYKIAGIVSIVVFMLAEMVFVFESPRIVFKYLFFFFGILANIIGCCICEYGDFYLGELSTHTHYVGALPTLIFAQLVLFTCIYEFEGKYEKNNTKTVINIRAEKIHENTLYILNWFVFILYLAIFVHVLPYSALRLNVDRMTFASMGFNAGIWGYLAKWAQFFVVIPIGCIAYTNKKRYKVFGTVTLIIYCFYYLWIGNKFGSFFNLFCVFCLLNFSKLSIKDKAMKKIMLIVFGMIAVMIIGAALIFTKYQNQGSSISSYLQNRLAEQGQLFWKTYEVTSGQLHISEIGNEIVGQIGGARSAEDLVGARFGVYNIMYLCAPKERVDAFILYGSRYTEAGYASILYYFGFLGCILFAVVFAHIIVSITNMIISSTRINNLPGMILMLRMYFIICTALSMFLFGNFFTGTSLLTYFWILYTKMGKKITVKFGDMHPHKITLS